MHRDQLVGDAVVDVRTFKSPLLNQMQWTVEAAFTPVEWSKYVEEVIQIFWREAR
jgi:hypothetical protein